MELNRVRIINELEGLVEFITCPEYIKDALSLIKELTEEVADLKAIAEQYQKQFEEAKAGAVKEIQTMLAMHFGTYTDTDTVKVVDVFKLLTQIEKEILEGEK